MKRMTSLVLILTLLLTLTACGGDSVGTDGNAAAANTAVQSADVSALYPDGVYVDLADAANADAGILVSNDIVYYEAGRDFTYGEGTADDAHTAEEAAAHTVVTITRPGTYILSGTLPAGQIAVDLGDDSEEDPDAVVTLVLNGVDITCTVAPAVIFYNVYECGSTDADTAGCEVDTSAAGANIILPDGAVNNVCGAYVARIYKSVVLSDDGSEVVDSKKLHKYDAAVYSKMTMNVDGGDRDSGVLNITAENEGLDTELHLTINGGVINIVSGNDGINTNEDGISVTTVNGGTVNIRCDGSDGEGDGIDSNGWLVINGGSVYAQACATSGDAGIDSDMGIYINGGTVMASGNMLDRIAGGSAAYAVFTMAQPVSGGKTAVLQDAQGNEVMRYEAENAYRYLVVSVDALTAGDYSLWLDGVQMAHGGMGNVGGMQRPEGMEGMEPPEGFDPSQMQRPEGMEGMKPPEGMERMSPPDGEGGKGFGGRDGMNVVGGPQTAVFTIAEGGNLFGSVAEYEADGEVDIP